MSEAFACVQMLGKLLAEGCVRLLILANSARLQNQRLDAFAHRRVARRFRLLCAPVVVMQNIRYLSNAFPPATRDGIAAFVGKFRQVLIGLRAGRHCSRVKFQTKELGRIAKLAQELNIVGVGHGKQLPVRLTDSADFTYECRLLPLGWYWSRQNPEPKHQTFL